ncbi:MAG: sulfatase-like hydrolase/transferase [Planctomycetota bacterium]
MAVAALAFAQSAIGQPSPNIILILSDDQGWTGLSAEMDPDGLGPLSASDFYETPNLEALAAQGMRFRQAYSAAPNCSPTRAAIQTGISPASLNLTDIVGRGDLFTGGVSGSLYAGNDLVSPFGAPRLPESVTSLAERIKTADPDYVTAHFGKWHLTTPSVQPSTPGGPVPSVAGDPGDYGYDVHDGARSNNPISTATDPKEMFSLTNRALGFVDSRAGANGATGDDRPFFLQIAHYATHGPDRTLAATQQKYDDKLQTNPGVRHPDGAGNTRFAGMTEDLDTTVGQIMDYLANTPDPRNSNQPLAANTYVIYTADNGATEASSSNLPLFDEKASTWEGGIRVPLIVRGPGVAPGSVSSVPVIATDLHATISSLAGATAPLPARAESADLTGVLLNGGELPSGVESLERGVGTAGELFFHFPHYQHAKGTTPMSAMVDGDFKLVRIYNAAGEPPKDYLFDLATPITSPTQTWETDDFNDPRNLAKSPAHAARLASMQQRFDAWIEAVDASLPYEVAEPVAVEWDAADNSRARNLEGPSWRSATDVDHRPREQLLIDTTEGTVEAVGVSPSQPELGEIAFRIDADGGFKRTFFHVSELAPTSPRLTQLPDSDDSATFEFWLRAASLDRGQVLLETGGGDSGLSITLGQADGDGVFDDIRLRASEGSANRAIEATASLAGFEPTTEFVHVVAVIRDDPAAGGQSAEIYLNGQLAAESIAVSGGGSVDWDGNDAAGIGMVQGVLGSSGGPGLGPLGSEGFAGDLSRFGFFNYALTPATIARRFNFDFAFIEGDLNGDGRLDATDVAVFRANWLADTSALSPVTAESRGDLDASGRVDLADWLALRELFIAQGAGAALTGAPAHTPEPSSATIAPVAAAGACVFRRRQVAAAR